MIQRIQSIYLLVITILMILPLCLPIAQIIIPATGRFEFYTYGIIQTENEFPFKTYYWLLLCINITTILIAFTTIFLYKRRPLQLRLCIIEIILCLLTFALAWFHLYRFSKDTNVEIIYRIGFILPVIAAILSYLALRGILKDINLIKSYDRIR